MSPSSSPVPRMTPSLVSMRGEGIGRDGQLYHIASLGKRAG